MTATKEGEQDAEEHAEHDEIGAVGIRVPHHDPAKRDAGERKDAQ